MLRRLFCSGLLLLTVSACATARAASTDQTGPVNDQAITTVPTISPSETLIPLVTNTRIPTSTPTPTHTLTPTLTPSITPTATPTAIPINSPTPDGMNGGAAPPTWTPPADDPATRLADHFHFRRPIPQGNTTWVDRTYPYGGTRGRTLSTHHGVEFFNPRGVPVLAVADGTVVYAGDDTVTMPGPINNYYGFVVIVEHDFRSPEGEPVFSLYGHLADWTVEGGQRVFQGDQVGLVGATGIAEGPHLHFETRVGSPFDFGATRNPELWLHPWGGYGLLVGQVADADGTRLYEVTIQVQGDNIYRTAFSYADDSVNPDPAFRENFTLGDIPAGYYEIIVRSDGRLRYQETVYVYPNRATWLDIRLN